MGLNMLLGFTGVLSFGHAAYFGLGAYGAGLTLRYLAHSTPAAIVAGTLLGGLAGTLFGFLIVRRRGVYFAMCTIAFGQLWYYLAYSWNSVTGGFDGLRDFHREAIGLGPLTLDISQGGTAFYYFLLAIFAIAVGLMGFLLRSPFGRTLLAIRENERRARFLGIPVERHIWLSFSISCFFTALAGTLYALLNNFADPDIQRKAATAFHREADMLAKLDNQHVPRVYDNFSEQNHHYLVMDYVEGITLEEKLTLSGRRLSEDSIKDICFGRHC